MQHTSRPGAIQALADTFKNVFVQQVANVKQRLAHELVQKIILFSAILCLLLVAANLENIL